MILIRFLDGMDNCSLGKKIVRAVTTYEILEAWESVFRRQSRDVRI